FAGQILVQQVDEPLARDPGGAVPTRRLLRDAGAAGCRRLVAGHGFLRTRVIGIPWIEVEQTGCQRWPIARSGTLFAPIPFNRRSSPRRLGAVAQGRRFMRETVLVTGSSGCVGAAVAERLAAAYQGGGLDRKAPPEAHAGMDHLAVDLCSDTGVRAGLEEVRRRHGEQLAAVVHLAAYCDLSGADSPQYHAVNVRGTERLLHGLQTFQIGQFVLGSTIL